MLLGREGEPAGSLICSRVWSGPVLLLFFKMIVYRKIKFKGECPSRRKD